MNTQPSETSVMRCLIVDDEAPARDELRYLLDGFDGVQVIGAAATAEEAELLAASVDYDIVFLDIRMPGISGLELASKLQSVPNPPEVIFTTAYPDHAVDAFGLSAADYLLKPLSQDRLKRAIARATELRASRLEPTPGATDPSTSELGAVGSADQAPAQAVQPAPQRLPVQRGERTIFVNAEDIVAAAASRGYTYLYLNDERVLVTYTLAELESRFPGTLYRVHRSYLANLERLVEMRPDFNGSLVLVMDDADRTTVPVARRHAQQLRRELGL